MAASSSGSSDSILYDLLVEAEWPLEGEILNKAGFDVGELRGSLPKKCWTVTKNSMQWFLQGVHQVVSGASMIYGIPAELYNVMNGGSQWNIALSSDGNLLAVLQETCIEIRSVKDEFGSVVATCCVDKDPCPQWQKLTWSQDYSMLACSSSSGEVKVFDLSGELLFTINETSSSSVGLPLDLSKAVCGLVFVEHKSDALWSAELLVICYDGSLTSYLVSSTNGFQENHQFSFSKTLHHGVYCVMYQPKYKMLVVGTAADRHGDSFSEEIPSAFDCGLSAWRMLSSYPHYKLIEDDHIDIQAGSDMFKRISKFALFRSAEGKDGVFHGCFSPDGTKLAVLHMSGTLSVWHMPSLRHTFSWGSDDQPMVENNENEALFNGTEANMPEKENNNFCGLTDLNWWSSETLILAHNNGAVMVSPLEESLNNLLGQSPERCEPWPLITLAHNGGFLILECEKSIKTCRSKQSLVIDEDNGENIDDDSGDEDDEDDASFSHKSKEFAKQVLFFLTESDRFQPALKRPKILYKTYRLVCIKSTTPEELYARKIELEEYGEALLLAQTYGLDCDLVYQKRWKKAKVSIESIHDYLSKVKNRLWVLNECVERVPDSFEAAKQLLEYGLRGTDARILADLGKENTNIGFLIQDEEKDETGDLSHGIKYPEEVFDFSSFSLEQRDICRYRLKLLQYLDRLSTYEVILGGAHIAYEEYSKDFFQQFRDVNIVKAAVEYARDGNWEALDAVFTYHGPQTLPHRLAILSNFPETKKPSDYKYLLPEAGAGPDDPEVLEWEQHSWRASDWCESQECKQALDWGDELDSGDFLYQENPSLQQYSSIPLTSSLLTTWYTNRAKDIESYSQQLLNSLELIKLAKERGVEGVDNLHDDLYTLEILIYECCVDAYLGLEDFQEMNDIEKLRMMLAKSSEVCFVGDFKRWALPFIARVEKRNRGSQTRLIHQYLTDIAKTDLTYVLKIFQNSTPELKEPVIADIAQQMKLALECIYICKRADQIDFAFSILECLPPPTEDILSDQIRELSQQIDKLEVHLCACEVLARHNIPKPVSYVVDTEGNQDEAKDLFKKMTMLTGNCSPPANEKKWKDLLKDMLYLQKQVYSCIEVNICYEVYTTSLLHSGIKDNILLAGKMLCKSKQEENKPLAHDNLSGPRIKYNTSVELVLEASREYFNSSNDLSDSAMELARTCLNIFGDAPSGVQEEYNLIAALALLDDFGVEVLPLEVRLCDDKLGLVQRAVESSPMAYKKTNKVLHLASLLQVSGQDEHTRKGRVLILVAEAALMKRDFVSANLTCQQLIKENYESAWTVCRTLGECEDFRDFKARQLLLAFALTYCSPDVIESLIHSRSLIETQILYMEFEKHIDEEEDEEEKEKEEKEMSGMEDPKESRKSLFSQMTHHEWWKEKVTWIRPLRVASKTQKGTSLQDKTETFGGQQFHLFYQSLIEDAEQKTIGLPYTKGLSNKCQDSSFIISHCLLRIQKLRECRAEGSIEEPASEVLTSLAKSTLKYDCTEALAYLLALPKLSEANDVFQPLNSNYFYLHMATYCFALEIYSRINPDITLDQALFYCNSADEVINHVISYVIHGPPTDWPANVQTDCVNLLKWYNQMIDFEQAQKLQSLGRGVDIGRFTCDLEYKKDTILGLALTIEDDIFNTALSLAERYDIPTWELMIGHLEWLFSDSGLATKEIQERVNKFGVMTCLVEQAQQTCTRMVDNIYPTIDGTMHARLIYYFMLLQECQERNPEIQNITDAQTHIKILRKIKSAAPGLDYKLVIDGEHPLKVLSSVLSSTNVHLLAKIASKIPTKNKAPISSSAIFQVFTEKLFWDGEQKAKDSETDDVVDWMHRFEACQKNFSRLTPSDLVKFVDAVTFSEKAFDILLLETRSDIVNRSLRFARQQDAARKKKGIEEEAVENSGKIIQELTFEQAISHLEHSARHLESLTDGVVYALTEADDDNETNYSHRYDLSRSMPDKINPLVSQMLVDGVSIDSIHELLKLASRQTTQTWKVTDVVQETLKTVLDDLSKQKKQQTLLFFTNKSPIEVIKTIIYAVSSHTEENGNLISQDDILANLRPFCGDVAVPSKIKTQVLRILEDSFDLSGEDTFLLIFCQTEAIVTAQWKRQLSPEDIDSDEKRHVLFLEQLEESKTFEELLSLGTLLNIWPVLAATELSEHDPTINPWVQLLEKFIECGDDGNEFLAMLKNTKISSALGTQCCLHVFDVLSSKCSAVVALKFGVISGYDELHDAVISKMKTLELSTETCDDELLEKLVTNNLVVEVAETPYLRPLVNHLLQRGDPDGELSVRHVAQQLQSAGYHVEAGTLLANSNNVHPVLRTLDCAIEALSHWLTR